MLGRLAVQRLARPARLSGEEPADPVLASWSPVMYHRRAADLTAPQRHAGFLGRLPHSRAESILARLDMTAEGGHSRPAA
jgi:hypothetical protein